MSQLCCSSGTSEDEHHEFLKKLGKVKELLNLFSNMAILKSGNPESKEQNSISKNEIGRPQIDRGFVSEQIASTVIRSVMDSISKEFELFNNSNKLPRISQVESQVRTFNQFLRNHSLDRCSQEQLREHEEDEIITTQILGQCWSKSAVNWKI